MRFNFFYSIRSFFYFILATNFLFIPYAEARDVNNVLIIGNSITKHGPSKKLGWIGNWGMAASGASLDYVSILAKKISSDGRLPSLTIISGSKFERGEESVEFLLKKTDGLNFDLIIVQLGDNSPKSKAGMDLFRVNYKNLISDLSSNKFGSSKLICVGLWWPNFFLNKEISSICSEFGGKFVDLTGLSLEIVNTGERDYPGFDSALRRHPGDIGMEEIATRVYRSIESR